MVIIIALLIIRFEDLRIRRVKKEGRKKPTGGDKSTTKEGRSDKIASLLFTAILETEHGEIVQSIKSRPISLSKLHKIKNKIPSHIFHFFHLIFLLLNCSNCTRACRIGLARAQPWPLCWSRTSCHQRI